MGWMVAGYLVLGLVVAALTVRCESEGELTPADALLTVLTYPVVVVAWAAGWLLFAVMVLVGRRR